MKRSKLTTPEWILRGFKSEEEYNRKKGIKTKKEEKGIFKLRLCQKCGSDEVEVALGKKKSKEWACKKCGWTGRNVKEKRISEKEFMEYLDRKGESPPDEEELKRDFKRTIDGGEDEDFEE